MYLLAIMAVFLFLYLFRLFRGPSVWDRLLGLSLVSTKVVIILIALASQEDLTFLLDLAIVYTLMGFLGAIFIAQFLLDRAKSRMGGVSEQDKQP